MADKPTGRSRRLPNLAPPKLLMLIGLCLALLVTGLTSCGLSNSAAQTRPSANAAEAAQPKATQTRPRPTRTPRATSKPTRTPRPTVRPTVTVQVEAEDEAADADPFIIRDVRIYDLNGRLAYRGDIDLKPTLDRIEQGINDSHRNDGAVFGNFEGRLPRKPRGYYREYVLRTPGISGPGPQRVILGQNDEIYYTPDHYETFIRVQ